MKRKIVKKAIHAPGFLNEPVAYNSSFSRGMRVDFGRTTILFISGTASVDEKGKTYCIGDFPAQAKRTFDNLTALLKSEGASWHDVIHTRCYLTDMGNYKEFNDVRSSFYKKLKLKPFPASACIEAGLCRPELLVEIEAIAVLEVQKNNVKRLRGHGKK